MIMGKQEMMARVAMRTPLYVNPTSVELDAFNNGGDLLNQTTPIPPMHQQRHGYRAIRHHKGRKRSR